MMDDEDDTNGDDSQDSNDDDRGDGGTQPSASEEIAGEGNDIMGTNSQIARCGHIARLLWQFHRTIVYNPTLTDGLIGRLA